jgi:hypothetical protein
VDEEVTVACSLAWQATRLTVACSLAWYATRLTAPRDRAARELGNFDRSKSRSLDCNNLADFAANDNAIGRKAMTITYFIETG